MSCNGSVQNQFISLFHLLRNQLEQFTCGHHQRPDASKQRSVIVSVTAAAVCPRLTSALLVAVKQCRDLMTGPPQLAANLPLVHSNPIIRHRGEEARSAFPRSSGDTSHRCQTAVTSASSPA